MLCADPRSVAAATRGNLRCSTPRHEPLCLLRGQGGPLSRPVAKLVDLLLHRLRQRHDSRRAAHQIVECERAMLDLRPGDGRYHALLDLCTRPSGRNSEEPFDAQTGWILAAALKMDSEDLVALVVVWQIDEEHFVEAPLADHFRRAAGRSGWRSPRRTGRGPSPASRSGRTRRCGLARRTMPPT